MCRILADVTDPSAFLLRHPYAFLFATVLVEQLGLPIPAAPFLLAAGALAGMQKLSLGGALALAVGASLVADLAWYQAGRRSGGAVLGFLWKLSLEPDSCVRRTEDAFARHGSRSLLVAKFIPGLAAVASPLAGIAGMRLSRFLLWDGLGALLWAGAYMGLGRVFSDQLEAVAHALGRLGGGLLGFLLTLVLGYAALKYVQRRRFMRELRIARITPEELKERLDAGEPIVVVDLRHSRDFEADPETVPGALHFTTAELEARHEEIPRDREIVLYCT
jgi:membrane protein DedA with SNARE-associated domain